jgi:hypothetical protein
MILIPADVATLHAHIRIIVSALDRWDGLATGAQPTGDEATISPASGGDQPWTPPAPARLILPDTGSQEPPRPPAAAAAAAAATAPPRAVAACSAPSPRARPAMSSTAARSRSRPCACRGRRRPCGRASWAVTRRPRRARARYRRPAPRAGGSCAGRRGNRRRGRRGRR